MNFYDGKDGNETIVNNEEINKSAENFAISINNDELLSKYNQNIKSVDIAQITNYISEKYSNEHNAQLFASLLGAMRKGNNRLVQHMLEQTLSINTDWIDAIQDGIFAMERIIARPKLSIRDDRELVKVEKAKRVDAVSVRHLSTHTQFIKIIKDDGSIVPSTVMTRNFEEEDAIYENRFLYALLQRIRSFVEKRYNVIVEYAKVKDNNALSYTSSFKYGKAEIVCNLNVGVKMDKELNQAKASNADLIERLQIIKTQLLALESTPFMKSMKKAKPVFPPIQRTNILISNPEYAACYKLWVTLSRYNTVGYSVNVVEKKLPFDENYYNDLTKIVATSVQVMLVSNKVREAIYAQVEPTRALEKEFKIKKNLNLLSNIFNDKKNANAKDIADVYYEKMKAMILHLSNLADALAVTSETEIPKKALFKNVFKDIQKINNDMFEDILKIECLETEKKEADKLEEKYKMQKKLYERYKQLRELQVAEAQRAEQKENAQLKKLQDLAAKIEKQKEDKRKQAEKAKLQKEKALLAKQKLEAKKKEIEKQKKQRELQRAKERKQKEKEKQRLQAEKIKEKERLKKQKEKEKELLRAEKERERKELRLKKVEEMQEKKRQEREIRVREMEAREKEKKKAKELLEKQRRNQKQPKKKESKFTKVHGIYVSYKNKKIIANDYDKIVKMAKRKTKK